MRRQGREDLVSSRRSIFYSLDMLPDDRRRKARAFLSELYPHMFYEDIRLSIAPIGGRSENPGFRVSVTSENDRAAETVETGLTRRARARDLAGAVCDFLQEAAGQLIIYGEATYETAYLSEREGEDPIGFELALVPSGSIRGKGRRTIQQIPPSLAKERGGETEIELEPEYLLELQLQKDLRKSLERMTRSLAFLSTNILPDFALRYALADPKRPPFQDADHVRARKLALAEVTRPIGWDARQLFNDELLEYYQLTRLLRFERFKAQLRLLILEGLNNQLDRVGQRLGMKLHVDVQGLPTAEDIDEAEISLRSGNRPFNEILRRFIRI